MSFDFRLRSVVLTLIFASLILPGMAAGYTCQSESAQYSAPNACGGCPYANLPAGSFVEHEGNRFIALNEEPLDPQPPAYDPEDLPPDVHCALGSFFPCVDQPTARFIDNAIYAAPDLFPPSRQADGFHPLTLLNVQESRCNSFESNPFSGPEFFTVNYGNTNPLFADDLFPTCNFRESDTAACPDLSCP